MAIFPGVVLPWIEERFLKMVNGVVVPNSDGLLYSYTAGTSTPQPLYSDVNLTLPWANPIILDSDGRIPGTAFCLPTGYRFVVADSDNVPLYGSDDVETWNAFAQTLGTFQSGGSKNVVSGYLILPTDRLVTVSSTGGPNPCLIQLPAASSFTNILCVKNVGTVPVSLTPFGLDTLEGLISTAFTIPAAASPSLPAAMVVSDGVSNWFIISSHKVP